MSTRGYQGYEDGRSVPGGEAIAGLVRLGINANWLLTGEGPMLLKDLVMAGTSVHRVEQQIAGYVAIPLYNGVRAAAGGGALVEHETPDDALVFKEQWVRTKIRHGISKRYLGMHPEQGLQLLTFGFSGLMGSGGVTIDGRHVPFDWLVTELQAFEGWRVDVKLIDPTE